MTSTLIALGLISMCVLIEWKTAALRRLIASAAACGTRFGAWIADEHGPFALLPELLPYREFHRDGIVESTDGMLWCGLQIQVPGTDGYSNRDFNILGASLSRALSGLPSRTHVQIINRIRMHSPEAVHVVERTRDEASPTIAAVYQTRIEFLEHERAVGRLRNRSTFVFLGIEPPAKVIDRRVRLRGLFSPSPWVDLERNEHCGLVNKLLGIRDTFASHLGDASGKCRPLAVDEIIALSYERLNPARSEKHPPPRYEQDTNPRELLCCTNVDVRGDVLHFGEVAAATLSLHRLPIQVTPKSVDEFYRSESITFPIDVSAHFRVDPWVRHDRKLDRDETDLVRRLNQNPSPDQEVKLEQIQQVRRDLRTGEEKIGPFGLAITLAAPNEVELRRRVDVLMAEARKCEGLELTQERTIAIGQHLTTLPCASHTDRRTKLLLSRHAAWLMGLSGAPTGLVPQEARIVFQQAHGGVLFCDQTSDRHALNHATVCGTSGSGKSVLLMQLRLDHLARGRRGFVIDYRTSGRRLVKLVDGFDIDITSPASAPFLADLFDIWPRGESRLSAGELNEDGLPPDRLFEVEELLARLCEERLTLEQRMYLNRAIRRTYIDLTDEDLPTMDDFLGRIRNPTRAEREPASWLTERLSVYRSDQALGRYFNQRGKVFDFSSCPLINFDFASSKGNSKLIFIGTLAAKMVIDRALFTPRARTAGSFLHVDEFGMLAQSPVLASTVDDLVRTARKHDMHITLASQRPEDFMEQENIKRIASDLPVRYLFNLPADIASKAFHLTRGQAQMVASLASGGSEYRECALVSPSIAARIRLRYGPVEGRLFMEAATGRERFSAAEALHHLPADQPQAVIAALNMEPRAASSAAAQN